MTETFDRIAAGHYRNAETGVEIVKVSADEAGRGWAGWIVTVPLRGLSFETTDHGTTKASVMAAAAVQVDKMRVIMACDFTEALAEMQEAAVVKSADPRQAEADDLIHLWTGTREPSACGLDIFTTPYTYGSPELAEVTCQPCEDVAGRQAIADRIVADVLADARPLNERVSAGFRVGDRVTFGPDVWEVSKLRINSGTGLPALSLIDPDNPSRWTSVYESTAVEWAENEAHREYAARIIEAARVPAAPADLNDDAAWAAYCEKLPNPTDAQIADVLAEFGNPYAAPRAEAVAGFKLAARTIWRIRATAPVDQLHADIITNLRAQMRTFRGVVEVFDQLTESYAAGVRADSARDSFTVKWADGVVTRVPYV